MRKNNKALYESIMRKVSKVVKRTLNETFGDEMDDIDYALHILNSNLKYYELEGVEITDEDAKTYLYLVNIGGYSENEAVDTVLGDIRDVLDNGVEEEIENEFDEEDW